MLTVVLFGKHELTRRGMRPVVVEDGEKMSIVWAPLSQHGVGGEGGGVVVAREVVRKVEGREGGEGGVGDRGGEGGEGEETRREREFESRLIYTVVRERRGEPKDKGRGQDVQSHRRVESADICCEDLDASPNIERRVMEGVGEKEFGRMDTMWESPVNAEGRAEAGVLAMRSMDAAEAVGEGQVDMPGREGGRQESTRTVGHEATERIVTAFGDGEEARGRKLSEKDMGGGGGVKRGGEGEERQTEREVEVEVEPVFEKEFDEAMVEELAGSGRQPLVGVLAREGLVLFVEDGHWSAAHRGAVGRFLER